MIWSNDPVHSTTKAYATACRDCFSKWFLPEERTIQPLAGVVCKKAEKRKRRRYENGHKMGRGFRCHMRGVGPWRPVCGADRSAARCAGNRSGEVRVAGGRVCAVEIGRASCRERGCQYV